ncbi:hypothetical protein D3C76_1227190 [compost metagenome]
MNQPSDNSQYDRSGQDIEPSFGRIADLSQMELLPQFCNGLGNGQRANSGNEAVYDPEDLLSWLQEQQQDDKYDWQEHQTAPG